MDNEQAADTEVSAGSEAFAEEPVETEAGTAEQAAQPEEAGEAQSTGEPVAFSDVEVEPEENAEASDDASEQDASPEEYSAFELPEGVTLQDERLESFTAWSKGVGLSQEQAQSAVDLYIHMAQVDRTNSEAEWSKLAADWTARSKTAGHLTKEARAEARVALSSVDPDGSLSKTLALSSLDKHPAIMAVFRHFGRSISSPNNVPTAQASGSPRVVDHAERLYPQQQKT